MLNKKIIIKCLFFLTLTLISLIYAKESKFKHIEIFPNKGNWHYRIPSIVVSNNGTIIAICNKRIGTVGDDAIDVELVYRTSKDNGSTWEPIKILASKPGWGMTIESSVVDRNSGEIMIIFSSAPNSEKARSIENTENTITGKMIARSIDNGNTWKKELINISPNSFKEVGNCHGSGTGITLKFSDKKGRLLLPARFAIVNEDGSKELNRDHFNCTIYSDDHGATWKTGEPLQAGTGEGCLVELSDGTIYYNSRAYHNDGKRRIGFSNNGGESFINFSISKDHPECNGGTNAALLAISLQDQQNQIILFSNPPLRTWRRHIDKNRKKMTIRISDDETKTWSHKKRIFKGPSGYSSLAQAKDDSILLLYEKGKKRYNDSGISLAKLTLKELFHGKIKDN